MVHRRTKPKRSRRFEDEWRAVTAVGRAAIRLYCRLSPPIALILEKTPALAAVIRALLRGILRLIGAARR